MYMKQCMKYRGKVRLFTLFRMFAAWVNRHCFQLFFSPMIHRRGFSIEERWPDRRRKSNPPWQVRVSFHSPAWPSHA